jgi:ABC-type transport system involved in multi-copper enzyme maturation permease subunit
VDALNPVIVWDEMAIGAAYNLIAFAVLMAFAVVRFDRKDITS